MPPGFYASPIQWTWVWVSPGSWWWTGKTGMLQSMGLQEWDTTEWLNWKELSPVSMEEPRVIFSKCKWAHDTFLSIILLIKNKKMLCDFNPVHVPNLFDTLPLGFSHTLSLLLLLQCGIWSQMKDFVLCMLSLEYPSFLILMSASFESLES